jgi:hypothetical protein
MARITITDEMRDAYDDEPTIRAGLEAVARLIEAQIDQGTPELGFDQDRADRTAALEIAAVTHHVDPEIDPQTRQEWVERSTERNLHWISAGYWTDPEANRG